MLAARDQENLVHGHQTAAASKPLNQNTRHAPPKTPGNKYPKTPLKVPLQDENAQTGFGGKSVLAVKGKAAENVIVGGKKNSTFDKNAFVTPLAPRNRAPLGAKTTNAKAKAFQTPAGPAVEKDLEKTQIKPTSTRRPKPKVSHAETIKLSIHGDETGPLEEREVEYAPPKPQELPYQSDDLPEGLFDSDLFKGGNLMRGWQDHYYNPTDENGVSLKEKKLEEDLARALKETDDKVRRAIEEADWSVGDVPETFEDRNQAPPGARLNGQVKRDDKRHPVKQTKGPGTMVSRNAASALSAAPRANNKAFKAEKSTVPVKPSTSFMSRNKKVPVLESRNNSVTGAVASRNTIGYSKGRTASNILHHVGAGLPRSSSNLSTGSDTTITPGRLAESQRENENQRWARLRLLGAFDPEDEDQDLEPALRGELPDCLREADEGDEEFVLTLGEN